MSQDLDVLRMRVERLQRVRLPLAMATGLSFAGARWFGHPVLIWLAVAFAGALIATRLFGNAFGNEYAARRLGDIPATPERVALKKRIDLLKTVQLVLVVLGVPCIAVCFVLRAPQAVTLASLALFVVGMLAGVHRQTLLNSYHSPYQKRRDTGATNWPRS